MPANIDATYIIQRPLLSEKSTYAMNEQKRYSFVVDARATKTEIIDAIEKLYKVRVEGINTVREKHKSKRLKFGISTPATTKKAIVSLHKDDTIELF
jgi:large subunit ribosomal protein L23